jgi:hypothetical protein
METIEIKSSRSAKNGIKPRMPKFMETMLNETQSAAWGSGMKSNETRTTANPAMAMDETVPGTRELYCSANLKNEFRVMILLIRQISDFQ